MIHIEDSIDGQKECGDIVNQFHCYEFLCPRSIWVMKEELELFVEVQIDVNGEQNQYCDVDICLDLCIFRTTQKPKKCYFYRDEHQVQGEGYLVQNIDEAEEIAEGSVFVVGFQVSCDCHSDNIQIIQLLQFVKFIFMEPKQLNLNFDLNFTSLTDGLKEGFDRLWEKVDKNTKMLEEFELRLNANRSISPRKIDSRKSNNSKEISLDFSSESGMHERINKELTLSEQYNPQQIDYSSMNKNQSASKSDEALLEDENRKEKQIGEKKSEQMKQNKSEQINIYKEKEEQQKQVGKQQEKQSEDKVKMEKEEQNERKKDDEEEKINDKQQIEEENEQNIQNEDSKIEKISDGKEKVIDQKQISEEQKNRSKQYEENRVENQRTQKQNKQEMKLQFSTLFSLISEMNNQLANSEVKLTQEIINLSHRIDNIENEDRFQQKEQIKDKILEQVEKGQQNQRKDQQKLQNKQQSGPLFVKENQEEKANEKQNQKMNDENQQLKKYFNYYVNKAEFKQNQQKQDYKISQIRQKAAKALTIEQLNLITKVIERKYAYKDKIMEINPQIVSEENDQGFEIIVLQNKSQINKMKQEINSLKEKINENTNVIQLLNKNSQIDAQQSMVSLDEYEKLKKQVEQMSEKVDQQLKSTSNTLLQNQQELERINNQIKFYNMPGNSATSTALGKVGSTQAIQTNKSAELQNQVIQIKRKLNKLIKLQQQGQNNPESIDREMQGVKIALEKKSDWQGLQKVMSYFENKIIEIQNALNSIIDKVDSAKNEETTAAKRGWTCLCCDKQIKKFQGKLSEAKFTSIFPVRYESPRIGGYLKQKQSDRQYKHIYLKHKRHSSTIKNKDEIN